MRFVVNTAQSVLEDLRPNSRSVLDIFEDRVTCAYIYQSVWREPKTSPSVLYKRPLSTIAGGAGRNNRRRPTSDGRIKKILEDMMKNLGSKINTRKNW